jgi:hypothetical protein
MQKLRIVPYADEKYETPLQELVYTVLVNPQTIEHAFIIDLVPPFRKLKSAGGAAVEGPPNIGMSGMGAGALSSGGDGDKGKATTTNFSYKGPDTMPLSLVFDATGAIVVDGRPLKTDVESQIYAFRQAVMDGETPRYVRLEYGRIVFFGRLESLSLKYTLFRPDATPLRATGDASFLQTRPTFQPDDLAPVDAIFKALMKAEVGTTIDEAATSLKGDPDQYMDIAIQNKIPHIRALQPDTTLIG